MYLRPIHSHALRQTKAISSTVQGLVTTRKVPRLTRTRSIRGARSNPASRQKTRNPRLLLIPGVVPPPQRLTRRFASATSSRKRVRRIIRVTRAPGSSRGRADSCRARAGPRAGFVTLSRRAGGAATRLHRNVGESRPAAAIYDIKMKACTVLGREEECHLRDPMI